MEPATRYNSSDALFVAVLEAKVIDFLLKCLRRAVASAVAVESAADMRLLDVIVTQVQFVQDGTLLTEEVLLVVAVGVGVGREVGREAGSSPCCIHNVCVYTSISLQRNKFHNYLHTSAIPSHFGTHSTTHLYRGPYNTHDALIYKSPLHLF